jgi:hypothetical protein
MILVVILRETLIAAGALAIEDFVGVKDDGMGHASPSSKKRADRPYARETLSNEATNSHLQREFQLALFVVFGKRLSAKRAEVQVAPRLH